MAQVSKYFTQRDVADYIQQLFPSVVTDLGSNKLAQEFLKDFFSAVELSIFSKRLVIALMIVKGYSQDIIVDALKVSSSTVSKVNRLLNSDQKGLYRVVRRIAQRQKTEQFLEYMSDWAAGIFPPRYKNRKRWYQERKAEKRTRKPPI